MNTVFFNAIASSLIALKILKSQIFLDSLAPESPPGLCLRSSDCCHFFSLIKLNLLPEDGHKVKCLDQSLICVSQVSDNSFLQPRASEKMRNICTFYKFCVFFYSCIFERTHLKLAFLMAVMAVMAVLWHFLRPLN